MSIELIPSKAGRRTCCGLGSNGRRCRCSRRGHGSQASRRAWTAGRSRLGSVRASAAAERAERCRQDDALCGYVPAGPVEDRHGMGAGADRERALHRMPVHGVGIAVGQGETGTPCPPSSRSPKMQGYIARRSRGGAEGRAPCLARRRRAILFFWPTRASSGRLSSISAPFGSLAAMAAGPAGTSS